VRFPQNSPVQILHLFLQTWQGLRSTLHIKLDEGRRSFELMPVDLATEVATDIDQPVRLINPVVLVAFFRGGVTTYSPETSRRPTASWPVR
jgi:hypothetical protein